MARIPERQVGFRDIPGMFIGVAIIAVEMFLAAWWEAGPDPVLAAIGGLLWLAGIFLLAFPIYFLWRRGGVAKGDSFVDTTRLVDTGIYAIVRHPQYLGWLTVAAALPIRSQRWEVAVLGAFAIISVSTDFRHMDAFNVRIFGEAYERYMAKVPGWNPIAGLWRWAKRRWRARR